MKKRKYPHLKIYEIAHKHPRVIKELTEIQTEKGTLKILRSMDSEVKTVLIPNKPNPNLKTIKFSEIKICWYLDQKKGFIYDKDGILLGKFFRHDLKRLFFEIGALLKEIKNEKG